MCLVVISDSLVPLLYLFHVVHQSLEIQSGRAKNAPVGKQVTEQCYQLIVLSCIAQFEDVEVELVNFLKLCSRCVVQMKHFNDDLFCEASEKIAFQCLTLNGLLLVVLLSLVVCVSFLLDGVLFVPRLQSFVLVAAALFSIFRLLNIFAFGVLVRLIVVDVVSVVKVATGDYFYCPD